MYLYVYLNRCTFFFTFHISVLPVEHVGSLQSFFRGKNSDLIQSVSFTDDLILMRLSSFSSVGASGFHPIRHKHGL